MRIVYIVLAHRYPEQLVRLVLRLNSENASFFIHIDKRTDGAIYHQVETQLCRLRNVYFIDRNKCYWGDFGIVQASIKGIDEIFKRNISFDWLILLTGQDYPLKSNDQIAKILEENEGKIFITHEDYQIPPDKNWQTSGTDRIHYWHFVLTTHLRLVLPPRLTASTYLRSKILKIKWLRSVSSLYTFLLSWVPIKERVFFKGFNIFLGSASWCFPKNCVEYIHDFVQSNPAYVNYFKYVECPDELFFQTIVLNSPFKSKAVNDNLFYIDWQNPNPKGPRVFVKDDFDRLANTHQLFGRKFDSTRDAEILDMIDEKILEKV